ncbi:MAG: hypothetical protein IJS26_00235 [Alphaproteobacteria bacterium]|nr:hypothetical protein [Alphaproteobacteria bacterium]
MIKKIVAFVLMIVILVGLYAWKTKVSAPIVNSDEPPVIAAKVFGDKTYDYQADKLSNKCSLDSQMACAVEFAVKCTLNPDYAGCRESKLPKFIFMTDESLNRPTKMSFKIAKIKPIAADLVEIHTDSTCDGNWFGLCQGRIIYVLVPNGEDWRVKDIYALEI